MQSKWFHSIQKEVFEEMEDYDDYQCLHQDVTRDRVYECYMVKKNNESSIIMVVMHKQKGNFHIYKLEQ